MEFFLEHPMLVTYLFLKLDGIAVLCSRAATIGVICLGAWSMFNFVEKNQMPPHFIKSALVIIFALLFGLLLPSSKDVAIMYGVSTGVTVGKNMAASPITSKSLELLNIYVEKELDKAKNSLEKSK